MALSERRKGEIALLLLKHRLRDDGIRLTPNFRREVGNDAKAIEVEIDEAMEFAEEIVRELVDETFPKKFRPEDCVGCLE